VALNYDAVEVIRFDLLRELQTLTCMLAFIPGRRFVEFDPSDAAEVNRAAHRLP
jgi:hypothetical protein